MEGTEALFCRSAPAADVVPTFKCRSERICLLLPPASASDGPRAGYLRTEDAERLQVCVQVASAIVLPALVGMPSSNTRTSLPCHSLSRKKSNRIRLTRCM